MGSKVKSTMDSRQGWQYDAMDSLLDLEAGPEPWLSSHLTVWAWTSSLCSPRLQSPNFQVPRQHLYVFSWETKTRTVTLPVLREGTARHTCLRTVSVGGHGSNVHLSWGTPGCTAYPFTSPVSLTKGGGLSGSAVDCSIDLGGTYVLMLATRKDERTILTIPCSSKITCLKNLHVFCSVIKGQHWSWNDFFLGKANKPASN